MYFERKEKAKSPTLEVITHPCIDIFFGMVKLQHVLRCTFVVGGLILGCSGFGSSGLRTGCPGTTCCGDNGLRTEEPPHTPLLFLKVDGQRLVAWNLLNSRLDFNTRIKNTDYFTRLQC